MSRTVARPTGPVRSGPGPARGAPASSRARRRLSPGRVLSFVLATAWLVVVIAPIYYMVLASFRSQGNYLTENPWLPRGGLTLGEYGTVFGAGQLGHPRTACAAVQIHAKSRTPLTQRRDGRRQNIVNVRIVFKEIAKAIFHYDGNA